MKSPRGVTTATVRWLGLLAWVPFSAHASFLGDDALDTVAEVLSWIVIIIAPVLLMAGFWMIHILPEKLAEKRHHPQLEAIKILCLLSLFFGGLLWPLAWLWAYTKPTLFKLAYGKDRVSPEPLAEASEEAPTAHPEPPTPESAADRRGEPH